MDITGDGAIQFFSNRIKLSSKWPLIRQEEKQPDDPSPNGKSVVGLSSPAATDAANFAGSM